MKIVETIQKRRSVRSYTGEPLREEHITQIKQYINQLQTPFGIKARIELIHTHDGEKPIKLGTYGWINGACDYLALIFEDAPFAETAAAYMFEQAVLFCTDLGLGTCWLGGSFSRSDFKKQVQLKPGETLKIVSPVGYTSDRKRFVEKYIIGAEKKHSFRKPFGEIFFDKGFDKPLTEAQAAQYANPLKMVRLAPSANNKQEWRVLLDDDKLHFYKKPYPMFDSIDIGIALSHFELTCKEFGIEGKFEILKEFPENNDLIYVISWINRHEYIDG